MGAKKNSNVDERDPEKMTAIQLSRGTTIHYVVMLAREWRDRFPSLSRRPSFLRSPPESKDLPALDHVLRRPVLPPTEFGELVDLHDQLTTYLVDEHFHARKDEGDFQTRYELAVETTRRATQDQEFRRAIDPTCGTGSFLLALVSLAARHSMPGPTIVGVERNLDSAAVAWFASSICNDLLRGRATVDIHCADVHDFIGILGQKRSFDLLVGNPPWVTWTDLPASDKTRWASKDIEAYKFVEVNGMEKRMGAANKDIGAAIVLRSLQELAEPHARFGFLFKRGHLNAPSMKAFRSGTIPHREGRKLAVHEVFSVVSRKNFFGADEITTEGWIGITDKGPVEAVHAPILERNQSEWSVAETKKLVRQALASEDVAFVEATSDIPLATTQAQIEIRHGIKHDCKDVYEIPRAQAEAIGWQCVYPTVKSRHVKNDRWTGEYDLVIVPNKSLRKEDGDGLAVQAPMAYQYLLGCKDLLETRKSQWVGTRNFYDVFGVGDYSFAPYKVAWVRLGWKPQFVVLPPVRLPNGETKPIVPGDHFLFIPTADKAYAEQLAALLNSPRYRRALEALSPKGKSSLPKRLIEQLELPRPASAKKESRNSRLVEFK